MSGRWKWASEVVKNLGLRTYTEPPYQPQLLTNTTPANARESIKNGSGGDLLEIWQKWVTDSIEAKHENELSLRTLYRCWGIFQEALILAEEKKDTTGRPQVVGELVALVEGFIKDEWRVSIDEIKAAQDNVDRAAREFADARAKEYMDPWWCFVEPEVR